MAEHEPDVLDVCESPIERMMAEGLILAAQTAGYRTTVWVHCRRCDPAGRLDFSDKGPGARWCGTCLHGYRVCTWGPAHHVGSLDVYLQKKIGPFRVDLLVSLSHCDIGAPAPCIAWESHPYVVECDGQAFHSTPEQRERDAARDRDLQARGYRVARFTGREINRSPNGAGSALIGLLSSQRASETNLDASAAP